MTISVLLIDEHAVFVEAMEAALNGVDDIEVVGVATNAAHGLAHAALTRPDVAVVDLELPDAGGVGLTRQLRSASSGTRVLILTGTREAAAFAAAMEASVSGYLLKYAGLSEVITAIRDVHAGLTVVPASVVSRLLSPPSSSGQGHGLTRREAEVLALMAEGLDLQRIARTLGITWNTARTYVKRILLKLDVHSQLQAVAKAGRLGMLGEKGELEDH